MADFINTARMNSIFPPDFSGGGFNPDMVRSAVNSIAPWIESQQRDQRNYETNMMAQQRRNQLEDIARSIAMQGQQQQQKQPAMTFAPPLNKPASEYEKGRLELDKKKLEETSDINQQRVDVTKQNVGINQQKANILDFKSKNPGLKPIMTAGGNVMFYNPADGKTIDTGIPTGTLSDADKLEITGEQRMQQIGAQGENQLANTRLGGTQNLNEIAANIAGRKEIKGMESGDAKSMLPTQTRVDQFNRARELVTRQPELAKFIQIGAGNEFALTGNPDPATLSIIQNAIFSNPKDIQLPPSGIQSSKPVEPAVKPQSKYKVTVEPGTK